MFELVVSPVPADGLVQIGAKISDEIHILRFHDFWSGEISRLNTNAA